MIETENIIRKATTIVGANLRDRVAGAKHSGAEHLAKNFVEGVVEELFLQINWAGHIKPIPKTIGKYEEFTKVNIDYVAKVIAIAPASTQWYIENKKLYFKPGDIAKTATLTGGFYYSREILDKNDINEPMPSLFDNTAALMLASQIAHSVYSDSSFTEGLKIQAQQKLEELKMNNIFNYHLEHSARF